MDELSYFQEILLKTLSKYNKPTYDYCMPIDHACCYGNHTWRTLVKKGLVKVDGGCAGTKTNVKPLGFYITKKGQHTLEQIAA